MNIVELDQAVRGRPEWNEFADELNKSMVEEYRLEGVTVFLREMTPVETREGEHDLLTFNQENQRFEFALATKHKHPPAWKIADRIDAFLNPNPDVEK